MALQQQHRGAGTGNGGIVTVTDEEKMKIIFDFGMNICDQHVHVLFS